MRRTYQVGDQAPLPAVSGGTWAEFMALLAGSIKEDLNRALEFWDEVTTLRPVGGPHVSQLRALDVVAWRLGVETGPVA